MDIPYDNFAIRGLREPNIPSLWVKMVQIGYFQSAPLILPTPVPKNRYQILATFWERCRYFSKKTLKFCKKRENCSIFSVLYKTFTTFAYNIRAPPSEV